MKKVVRMLGLCALVALAFSACKKIDTTKVSFTATINQPTTNSKSHARSMYNEYFLVWDNGDEIKVFNEAGEDCDYTLTSVADKVATFVVEDAYKINFVADLETADYTAFYPNAVIDGDNVKLNIPAEQAYKPLHNFDNNTYPMVGFNNGTNFGFTSDAGFLYLVFQAPENQTRYFDKVVLTANDPADYLVGQMVYDKNGGNYRFVGTSNVVTVVSTSKLAVVGDLLRDVTFILPKGALWSGFTVDVYDGETCVFSKVAQPQVNFIQPMHYLEMPGQTIE